MPERVVEHVVNAGHRNTQAASGGAVNLDIGLQALVLQIAGDINQLGQAAQPLQQGSGGGIEFAIVGAGHQKLVLRFGNPVFNAQVLHGLQIQLNAGHFAGRLNDAPHHLGDIARIGIALGFGFQVDQQAPRIQGGVGTIDPDKAGEALHGRVFQDDIGQRLLVFGHGPKRGRLRGFGDALNGPGILQRKKPFGHHKIKPGR